MFPRFGPVVHSRLAKPKKLETNVLAQGCKEKVKYCLIEKLCQAKY